MFTCYNVQLQGLQYPLAVYKELILGTLVVLPRASPLQHTM